MNSYIVRKYKQFSKWSLPSKLTFWGVVLALLSFLLPIGNLLENYFSQSEITVKNFELSEDVNNEYYVLKVPLINPSKKILIADLIELNYYDKPSISTSGNFYYDKYVLSDSICIHRNSKDLLGEIIINNDVQIPTQGIFLLVENGNYNDSDGLFNSSISFRLLTPISASSMTILQIFIPKIFHAFEDEEIFKKRQKLISNIKQKSSKKIIDYYLEEDKSYFSEEPLTSSVNIFKKSFFDSEDYLRFLKIVINFSDNSSIRYVYDLVEKRESKITDSDLDNIFNSIVGNFRRDSIKFKYPNL